MKRNKITILFVINKHRINSAGLCSLKCRITYLNKRKEFSTGLFVNPNYWSSKKQLVGKDESESTNVQLSIIKQEINSIFLFLKLNQQSFDVNDIYLKYKGETTSNDKTILEVFDLHNERMKKLIGKEYSESTYKKFIEAKAHTKGFISKAYGKNDYLLNQIKLNFLDDFDFYLKSEKRHKQITINKTIQRLRKIIKLAIAEGFLDRDPFLLYKPKKVQLQIIYLTPEELETLETFNFKQVRLRQVRDLFIFCCYTGLAYQEMSTFKESNIIRWNDGSLWIEMFRQKTKSKLSIPLLTKAIQILEKYEYQLPRISNQKMNSYLKEIAGVLGIDKNLTHHVARKTFATTVLLYNNVPIEIVSKLLGHSKIGVTQQHYGEILKSEILKAVQKLK